MLQYYSDLHTKIMFYGLQPMLLAMSMNSQTNMFLKQCKMAKTGVHVWPFMETWAMLMLGHWPDLSLKHTVACIMPFFMLVSVLNISF